MLASLALVSAGLTLLILDDADTKAQVDPTVWKAENPKAAVDALLMTLGFSSFNSVHIPGVLPDGHKMDQRIRAAAFNVYPELSEIRDGRKTPLFQVRVDPESIVPYEVQSAFPRLGMIAVKSGNTPTIAFVPGANAIFVTPDGEENPDQPEFNEVLSKFGSTGMDPGAFLFDIVNDKVVAEKQTTPARLRNFAGSIRAAMEEGVEADLGMLKLGSKSRNTEPGVFKLRVVLDPFGSPTTYAVEEVELKIAP